MRLTFLGCGDAFGSGGRFQTCFLVEARQTCFLIDCGASSLVAMRQQGVDPDRIDAVVLSHFHGDHFGGLPFLVLDAQFISRRSRDLTIAGPVGVESRVTEAMESLFRGSSGIDRSFSIRYVDLVDGVATPVDSIRVTAEPVLHGEGSSAHGLRVECDDTVVAYSGDTAWTASLPRLAKGADLFICEASHRSKKTSGHLDYETLLTRRPELECRRLILTHLGADVLAERDGLELECAQDGLTIDL